MQRMGRWPIAWCGAGSLIVFVALACCQSISQMASSDAGRTGGGPMVAAEANASEGESPPVLGGAPNPADRLGDLVRAGLFPEFVDEALRTAARRPGDPDLLYRAAEALLAAGRNLEAEHTSLRAAEATSEVPVASPGLAEQALKLWTLARLRGGKSLTDPTADRLLARLPDCDALTALRFWRAQLGEQSTYRLQSAPTPATLELARSTAWTGLASHDIEGIPAKLNDYEVPMAFIDTGGQHTLLSAAAARAAGVELGPESVQFVGFASFRVRPGVLKRLTIGSLVLENVPILAGDSAPLVAAKGQVALGVDVMHHLRFAIDYTASRVEVSPAGSQIVDYADRPAWDISVWTFPQSLLAQGRMPDGQIARVLVDTGNCSGTYVSPRWADANLLPASRIQGWLAERLRRPKYELVAMELGGQTLSSWPVLDTLPPALDKLDVVDVLAGHDLLWQYKVTIDLAHRRLRLEAGVKPESGSGR